MSAILAVIISEHLQQQRAQIIKTLMATGRLAFPSSGSPLECGILYAIGFDPHKVAEDHGIGRRGCWVLTPGVDKRGRRNRIFVPYTKQQRKSMRYFWFAVPKGSRA